MKTISEFLNGENLWEAIYQKEPFPFITPEVNMLFLTWYGNLPLFSKLTSNSVDDVAKMVVALYREKWEGMLEIHGIPIAAKERRTVKEKVTRSQDRTNNVENLSKVSGFNEDELITESGNTSTNNEGTTGEEEKELIDIVESLHSAYDNLTKAEQLNILKSAMSDVANFMKLDIY